MCRDCASCPKFAANRLKPNMWCVAPTTAAVDAVSTPPCSRECLHSIFSHEGTSPEEQAAGTLAADDRTPCKIVDGLLMGNMMAALNDKALADAGVTHVVNCALGIERQWPKVESARCRWCGVY